MSGVVHAYGCPTCGLVGYVVTCQGKSAPTGADGTYSLTGLVSGETVAYVVWPDGDETDGFATSLNPGSNTVSFDIY
jgi:hypothetical protein